MTEFVFNRDQVKVDFSSPQLTVPEIRSVPGLYHASLQDAILYGGDALRYLLASAPLEGTRRHVVVDSRWQELIEGDYPSPPGWHTDAGFRGERLVNGLSMQEDYERPPIIHLFGSHPGCPTQFIASPRTLALENTSRKDYEEVDRLLRENPSETLSVSDAWATYDWWMLHRPTPMQDTTGVRLLVRVIESDHVGPTKDLREVFRRQSVVYRPVPVA